MSPSREKKRPEPRSLELMSKLFNFRPAVHLHHHSLRDDTELARLDQLGMEPGDESKILVLRDYILKLADASRT
jgi:hypothetical protein